MERYYLYVQLTNTQEQDASSVATYNTLDSAKVAYHDKCKIYNAANDVLYAVVQIKDFYGRTVLNYDETIDHRPAPEPEA